MLNNPLSEGREMKTMNAIGLMKRKPLAIDTKGMSSTLNDKEAAVVEEPLSPRAKMFVHGSSVSILVTMGFDSPIDVDTFRKNLPLTLLQYPRFSSVLVGDVEKNNSGELKWVHIPHVNIDEHIILPSINPALNTNSSKANKFVEDYLYNLSKGSMDMSKPLWEFHILNVKTSEAESIGIFRIHHSLGDGLSLISLLLACSSQVSDPNALPTIPTLKKKEKGTTSFVLVVLGWLRLFWNTITGVLMFLATTIFLRDSNVLFDACQDINVKPRRIVHRIMSLDDMKLIKNAMGVVTINDVALGIIEGGLSRYLIKRSNDKEKDVTINSMKNIRMRTSLVVNLRPFGIQSFGDMMDKVGLGNQFGFVLLPLAIRIADDPLDYVRQAKAKIDRKKRSLEALYTLKIGEIALKLFGAKVAGFMSFSALSNVTMCVSNVPGPLEEIGFYGHAIKFIAPTISGVLNPVTIHLQSYTKKMSIVVSVREDANADPIQLCDDIAESLTLLKDSVAK